MTNPTAQLYLRLLILRCQAGDETALTQLIARFSPGLRFFLRKMTGQISLADDLLQDTWLDVYRKINRLQQPQSFTPWLYRIARDKAYATLRRHPRHAPVPGDLADLLPTAEETFTPDEAAHVRAALDDLPHEHREILVLRFIEEMSYDQIAQVISRPLGTVRSRIHYAKRLLREKFEKSPLKRIQHD